MKERDIQNYLYANPEVLFPSGDVTEKASEYSIHGKRIDLLFVVDGVRYIVEIKNVPIQREHIGQVVEYYGLMRHYMKDANLAMILVSSSIPAWRAAYLEELGIRCVEIPAVPTTEREVERICKDTITYSKKTRNKIEVKAALGDNESVPFDEIACPANPKGMAFARRMLAESLEPIRAVFTGYDIIPFGITRPSSQDYDLEYDQSRNHGSEEFTHGGIWWAYRFGFSEDMPKNDVPNISITANSTGLDLIINAELQPSQKVRNDWRDAAYYFANCFNRNITSSVPSACAEISVALRNDCITHRMVTICDWTKFVWTSAPAILGLYAIWFFLRKKE